MTTTLESPVQASSFESLEATSMTEEDISKLLGRWEDAGPVASLYLPMEIAGAKTRKNPIVFKNALSTVEEVLDQGDFDSTAIRKQCDTLASLCDPMEDFWQHRDAGLALFFGGSKAPIAVDLPSTPDEKVFVGDSPLLYPLSESIHGEEHLALVVNLSDMRLYRSNGNWIKRIALEDVPTSLDEAMKYDDPDSSLQFRSSSPAVRQGSHPTDAAYHGHGGTGDEEKNRQIDRFFEMVNSSLANHFPSHEIPLHLSGSPELTGRFANFVDYAHLRSDHIDIQTADVTDAELATSLKDEIAEVNHAEELNSLLALREAMGTDLATCDPSKIAKAMIEGRVEHLWLRDDAEINLTYDPEKHRTIEQDGKSDPHAFANFLFRKGNETNAKFTLVKGNASLPENSECAAILRY